MEKAASGFEPEMMVLQDAADRGESRPAERACTPACTLDADIAALLALWPDLPPAVRESLLRLAEAARIPREAPEE